MIKLRNLLPAMLAMALALMSTVVAAVMVQREVTRVEQRQFQMEAMSVKDAIAGSMRGYALGLSAGAALFQTVGDVSGSQWRDFVTSLELANAYPGYQGLGFAQMAVIFTFPS